jgi:hypothetical protein
MLNHFTTFFIHIAVNLHLNDDVLNSITLIMFTPWHSANELLLHDIANFMNSLARATLMLQNFSNKKWKKHI